MNNPLLDNDFLKELDLARDREIFAKIISLSLSGDPIEEIEGKVTGGSINIDGTSAIRRSCSLTMVADDVDINEYYWGVKTRFQLFIGLKVPERIRNIEKEFTVKEVVDGVLRWQTKIEQPYLNYPEIIWFKQGVFVINSFTTSHSANNYTINISAKDKMCLLNGDIGGNFPSQIDFGKEEFQDLENEITTITSIPLKTIIRNMIHVYGDEPFSNIVVNDIEDSGLELLEYKGDDTIYMFKNIETDQFENMTFSPSVSGLVKQSDDTYITMTISDARVVYDHNVTDLQTNSESDADPTIFNFVLSNETVLQYTVVPITYGQLAGYRLTDLTYPGDLIANIGETVTSILDKLVNMLGNFEYYYDIDGKFIFQEKQNYVNISWNPITEDGESGDMYVENSSFVSPLIYSLDGNTMITSFSNNPNLSNVKNDYIVWGTRKGISGADIPIHMRIAIDKKPEYYKTFKVVEESLIGSLSDEIVISATDCKNQFPDYFLKEPSFYVKDAIKYCTKAYKEKLINEKYDTLLQKERERIAAQTKVSYEFITEDYIGIAAVTVLHNQANAFVENLNLVVTDWREIIYQMQADYYLYNILEDFYYLLEQNNLGLDYMSIYPAGETGYERYYADIQGFWRTLYNPVVNPDPLVEGLSPYIQYYTWIAATETTNGHYQAEKFSDIAELKQFDEDMPYYIKDVAVTSDYYDSGTYQLYRVVKPDAEEFDPAYTFYLRGNVNDVKVLTKALNEDLDELEARLTDPDNPITTNEFLESRAELIENYNKQVAALNKEDTNPEYTSINIYDFKQSFLERFPFKEDNITRDVKLYTSNNFNLDSAWSMDIYDSPDTLNFWIDFLDSNGELAQYSIPVIGDRPKAVNDSSVTAIYFKETPNILFYTSGEISSESEIKTGYTYINLTDETKSLFQISGVGKDAKSAIDTLLYNFSYCIESVSISCIPIYHFEPNRLITVIDTESGINGEYLIQKMTIPLQQNGTMSISATKMVDRLY